MTETHTGSESNLLKNLEHRQYDTADVLKPLKYENAETKATRKAGIKLGMPTVQDPAEQDLPTRSAEKEE